MYAKPTLNYSCDSLLSRYQGFFIPKAFDNNSIYVTVACQTMTARSVFGQKQLRSLMTFRHWPTLSESRSIAWTCPPASLPKLLYANISAKLFTFWSEKFSFFTTRQIWINFTIFLSSFLSPLNPALGLPELSSLLLFHLFTFQNSPADCSRQWVLSLLLYKIAPSSSFSFLSSPFSLLSRRRTARERETDERNSRKKSFDDFIAEF